MDKFRRITIIDSDSDDILELNDKIQSFSNSIGMFNDRDREKSCFRIFVNLLKENKPLSSDEIAEKSRLSRGTVIHHIIRLRSSGVVVKKDNKYMLKTNNLEDLTNEIEKDLLSTMEKIRKISKEIDKELGFMDD
jgi:predicted transcriptional regulator